MQTLHNDCSHIENVYLIFCTHFMILFIFFFLGGGLEVRFFFRKMVRCLVCVICNSNHFHSLIFKLCIMIVHKLNMCNSYFVHNYLKISHF